MARLKKSTSKMRPATTPEAEENQLIALAVDQAKQQLIDGTASAQVLTHYLKLGTQKARLEMEILKQEKALMEAKTESLKSSANVEELFKEAMAAFRSYSGQEFEDED